MKVWVCEELISDKRELNPEWIVVKVVDNEESATKWKNENPGYHVATEYEVKK